MGKKEYWRAGNMLYPLPAVMVSCQRGGERPNIITVAWTGTVCSDPAMVYISVRESRHSYDIIRESGEFVINLTTEELARATDVCGVKSGRDTDKFALANLTSEPASKLSCPMIAQSPLSLECKVTQVLPLGSHDMFLAKIIAVNVEESLLDEKGKLHLSRCGLLSYAHGEYFAQGRRLGGFGYSVRKKVPAGKRQPPKK